jgi:hypothetical protein
LLLLLLLLGLNPPGPKGKVNMPSQLSLFAALPQLSHAIPSPRGQAEVSVQTSGGSHVPAFWPRGVCCFCRCHGNSCRDRTGERCDWLDDTHTCCDAERCRGRLTASTSTSSSPAKPPAAAKPAKVALKKRYYAGNRVDRAWSRYFSS